MKERQDIKVDFASFPQNVVELLDLCASADETKYQAELVVTSAAKSSSGVGSSSSSSSSSSGQEGAAAVAPASVGLATLNLIETNSFKNLVHLSLTLAPGTDNDVKTYLASCLRAEKNETDRLQTELDSTVQDYSSRLEEAEQGLVAKTEEGLQIHAELAATASAMQAKHAKEVAGVREATFKSESELQASHAKELQERASQEAMRAGTAEATTQQLTVSNQQLAQTKAQLEDERRDLKSKLRSEEERGHSLQRDLESCREQILALESCKLTNDAAIADGDARLLELSKQLGSAVERSHDQSVTIATVQGEADTMQQKYAALEAQYSIARHESDVQKREAITSAARAGTYENELKTIKGKMNMKNEVIVRQELVIEKLQHESTGFQETQSRIEHASLSFKAELSETQTTLSKVQADLDEKSKLLKNSENVITWLNRQLNAAASKPKRVVAADSGATNHAHAIMRHPLAKKTASDMNSNNAVRAVTYRRIKDAPKPTAATFGEKYLSSPPPTKEIEAGVKSRLPLPSGLLKGSPPTTHHPI